MADPTIADAAAALLAKIPDSPEARALRDVAIGKDRWHVEADGIPVSWGGKTVQVD